MTPRPYHHGDLRRALLDAAAEAINESGPADLSLRQLAQRVGVSHAAPAHHFGDKTGLLTALAAEGYDLLADELAAAWARTGDFLEVGVAYVRFAVNHRAHFEIMYRADLLRTDDPELRAARARSGEQLYGPVKSAGKGKLVERGVAAWALVHGLAELWMNGVLPAQLGDDPERVTRAVAKYLVVEQSR